MRLTLLLALGLSATALISTPVTRRATLTHAASLAPQKQSGPAAKSKQPTAPQASRTNTPTNKLVVREIDAAGLTKLLARDSAQPRPLLVNFWATWCGPCREEFPDLVRIDEQYRPRGLEFITVSLDEVTEINTTVPQFLQEMRAGALPAYLLHAAEPEEAINAVDTSWDGQLPATFLYDARGKLIFKHMGRIKPAELRAAIEKVMSAE